jgi:radical SAM enzyme (TIGR01210 family)
MLDLFTSERKRYEPALGRPASNWFLLLPGAGCSWAKTSGGCHMCGFKEATYRYTHGHVMPPFVHKTLFGLWRFAAEGKGPEVLNVFNGGSFFNPAEIPQDFQKWFFRKVGRVPGLTRVLVETRPEYVTRDRLQQAVEDCGDVKLTVGIGLECRSDEIRGGCVNKGFDLADFERAVETVKDCGAGLHTYVLLKPLYLSERQAVAESIHTVRYAFGQGSYTASLECSFIQRGTQMSQLYEQGSFRPPWLWSIAEVLKSCAHMGTLYVGNFEDEPPPIAVPYNCDFCSNALVEEFQRYNVTTRVSGIQTFFCGCFEDWWKEYRTLAPEPLAALQAAEEAALFSAT